MSAERQWESSRRVEHDETGLQDNDGTLRMTGICILADAFWSGRTGMSKGEKGHSCAVAKGDSVLMSTMWAWERSLAGRGWGRLL